MRIVTRYRAVSFGRPVGPWRDDLKAVRLDLIELKLGSYDKWGKFFITVPGDIERMSERCAIAA